MVDETSESSDMMIPYPEHLAVLRQADLRFQEERDRRYAEVNVEKEKALVIKDTANRDALALARQDQTYKDEQANKLREQINSERGLYATKDDLANAVREMSATIKPIADFVSSAGGKAIGSSERKVDYGLIIQVGAFIALAITLIFKK